MRRKSMLKRATSVMLVSSLLIGSLTGCGGSKKDEVVTLDVYSQLANYSGLQTGWIADILLEKFNVKLNIINNGTGVYETRMEDGDLGDIVIFGDENQYAQAVKADLLFDWNEDDLLTDMGPYIKEHMPDAIKKNQTLTSQITKGEKDTLLGLGSDIALSSEDHMMFLYNWDLRWDLYKELGYPEVKSLDDLANLLKDMQELCPEDDSGNKTYGVSMWPDWDKDMVMYVKATASAIYGYDELGIGLYDTSTGNYYGALEENGPYLEMLKFYNNLYQMGLVDPDSMAQTYDKMIEKVRNGGVFLSIFNYSGSLAYNNSKHLEDGKMMYPMKPANATPLVYGMNTQGGTYVTAIGKNTEYPELCMEVLNYFCTPEGCMTYRNGPQSVCWDYDEEGNTYLTDLGKECKKSEKTKMPAPYKGTYHDGVLQAAFATWAVDAENPDSNGETYNYTSWKSNIDEAGSEIEKDWRTYNGVDTIDEYFEKAADYVVIPGTSFALEQKSPELQTTWSQVTDEIRNGTWKAIYAETNAEFEKIVNNMIAKAKKYGYDECIDWIKGQAAIRHELEQDIQTKKPTADDEEKVE